MSAGKSIEISSVIMSGYHDTKNVLLPPDVLHNMGTIYEPDWLSQQKLILQCTNHRHLKLWLFVIPYN